MFRNIICGVLILGIIAACDETQNNQQTTTNTSTTTTSVTKVTEQPKETWIWPGSLDDAIAQDNLTQTNIMIVYDDSGSMGDPLCDSSNSKKYNEAVKAMDQFIDAIPFGVNTGLYTMNRGLMIPLGSNTPTNVKQAVRDATPGGGTPIASSMKEGYDQLTKQAKKQLGYGRYILLVVTDGIANNGEDPKRLINQIVVEKNIPIEIHAVGICVGENHSLRQPGLTFYTVANDTKTLVGGLKSVLAESPDFDKNFNVEK